MLDYTIHKKDSSLEDVVFIHGFGGNSKIFNLQLKSYKEHFNVITIELPGHGESADVDSYKESFSWQLAAREVVKTLEQLGVKKAHFVGVSLGTIIIHQILQDTPARVKSVVMAGTVTRFNLTSKALLTFGKLIKPFTPHLWIYKLFAQIMMPKANHKKSRDSFIREAVKMKRKNFMGWYDAVQTIETTYTKVQEKASHIKKLYISGSEDHFFIDTLKDDIKTDPNAQMIIFEKCGHLCNIEKYRKFNEVSVSFLLDQVEKVRKIS
ncbi:alpha/beta hydrolase [Alkalihalophilus lindianensis]|uniref:Alpha/beta hydrolase n=1 Tax=Alkalihalophilus lindianensis TaxID=1630542 RepID=A0ABU3X551_9BACI|nr:alpha/beta hydrolase [Alkalihalophilus lindianensis]MDV2683010.1 alpha/beta hydrolase [Alkalihalophilus lindianensis]